MSADMDAARNLARILEELGQQIEGATLAQCKQALDKFGGDASRAAGWLVEKGLAKRKEPDTASDEIDESLDDPDFQGNFLYAKAKAEIYLKVGPEIYRSQDFYAMPDEEWPEEWLAPIRHGMEQINALIGYSVARPLLSLGMVDVLRLLHTLHFEIVDYAHDVESSIAAMVGKHVQDERQMVLYFVSEAPREIQGAEGSYGFEPSNPVPVDGPSGERLFLSCIKCDCGEPFMFHRPGNVGEGPDGHVVDVFELVCRSGEHRTRLYLDLYHPRSIPVPPKNMQIGAPLGVGVSAAVDGFEELTFDQMVDLVAGE